MLQRLFSRYDTAQSGRLDAQQLGQLLGDLNGGERVSDAEVEYSLHLADQAQCGSIQRKQLQSAVVAWRALRADQRIIDERFGDYDTDENGLLGRAQVQLLLRDVNRGRPVSTEELDWIINRADADRNGSIDLGELRTAVALWYLHVTKQSEQKQADEAQLVSSCFFCCSRRPKMESYEYPGALSDDHPPNAP
jgi:Ca2+-binding EF-hand superfamily protein